MITGRRGWVSCGGALLIGWGVCVEAQNITPGTPSSCSGRFPPVTCLEHGFSFNNGAADETTVLAPASIVGKLAGEAAGSQVALAPDPQDASSDDDAPLPGSKDELFGTEKGADAQGQKSSAVSFRGFLENRTAYTYADPAHWSRAVTYVQLGASGQSGDNLKWKVTARADVDPVYIWSNFYNEAVKQDQRANFLFEETYVDASLGNWDLRIGRQQIVWGEVVGLFVADVVSAQNQLEFILPPFDIIRIPQWAARGEYFFGDSHLELIWIPYPTYNNIGKPGADFYPVQTPPPAGYSQTFLGEVQPDRTLANTNYGLRLSTLKSGWDVSAFYYSSEDAAPTFIRNVVQTPTPTVVYQPVHDRIWQVGGTLGKAFGSVVFHAETVYTSGREYEVTQLTQPNGVVPQNTLEYIVSVDFTLPKDLFLNVQLFQTIFFNHNPDLLYPAYGTGASVLLRGKLGPKLEPEILWIQGFNPSQNLIRPRLTWRPATNWRASVGVDIFNGPITTQLGRFNDRDRVYAEVRFDF